MILIFMSDEPLRLLSCLGLDQGPELSEKEGVEVCPPLAVHPIKGIGQRQGGSLRTVPTEIIVAVGKARDHTGQIELSRPLLPGVASTIVVEVMFIGDHRNQIGQPTGCQENFSSADGVLPLAFPFIKGGGSDSGKSNWRGKM